MSIPFTAVMTDTGIRFEQPSLVESVARKRWAAGEIFIITLHDYSELRSILQNDYLHAEPIRKFCAHSGYTPAQQKLVLLGEYFGLTQLSNGVWVPEKISTSQLTKREMSEWIEWLIQRGAENDPPLNILPPEHEPAKRDQNIYVEQRA